MELIFFFLSASCLGLQTEIDFQMQTICRIPSVNASCHSKMSMYPMFAY